MRVDDCTKLAVYNREVTERCESIVAYVSFGADRAALAASPVFLGWR